MNRRRHANLLPFASVATWFLFAVFACGAGLYYVWCKNELHELGSEIQGLEKTLAELQNQDEVVRARIAVLSSPNALRRRREQDKTFLAEFVDITQDRLVLVSDRAPGTTPAPDLRAVSNPTP